MFGGPLHVAFADFDRDGRADMAIYGGPVNSPDDSRMIAFNRSPAIGTSFSVIVQDAAGRRTQQGRVIRATKIAASDSRVISRMVDGGSGYLTSSEYPVMIGTPDSSPYRVEVTLPNASGQPVVVAATARSGEIVTITKPDAAHPGGQVNVSGRDLTPSVLSTDVTRYVGTAPTRLLDTRPTSLTGYSGAKPGPGDTVVLSVGIAPSPAVGPVAAALNITATDANGGFVTVYPCDQPRPKHFCPIGLD